MKLSEHEIIELQYMYLKGYKYLTKSEFLGYVRAHYREPKYYKTEGFSANNQWADNLSENGNCCPFANYSLKVGKYEFLNKEDFLMIKDLIDVDSLRKGK